MLWVVLPLANYFYWRGIARQQSILLAPVSPNCATPMPIVVDSNEAPQPCPLSTRRLTSSAPPPPACRVEVEAPALLELHSSELVTMYKHEQLARMRYPPSTTLLNAHPGHSCVSYANPHASQKGATCAAVVFSPSAESSFNLLRFDFGPRWGMRQYRSEGRAAAEAGREATEAGKEAAAGTGAGAAEPGWNAGVTVDADAASRSKGKEKEGEEGGGAEEGGEATTEKEVGTCARQGANWWMGKDRARVLDEGPPCSAFMPTGFFTKVRDFSC